MNGCLKAFLIGVAVLVGLALLGAILAPADDDPAQSAKLTTPARPAEDGTTTTDRESTIEDDVVLVSCNVTEYGSMAAQLQVTNNSSDRSNYMIEVAFNSADGAEQYATGSAFVSGLEPGQTASQEASGLDDPPAGGYVCEVQDVTRFSDE